MNETNKVIELTELSDAQLQTLYLQISINNRINEQSLQKIAVEIVKRSNSLPNDTANVMPPPTPNVILPKLKKMPTATGSADLGVI